MMAKIIALETAPTITKTKFAYLPQHWQALATKAVSVAATTARRAGMQTLEERPIAKITTGLARTVAIHGLLLLIARRLVEHAPLPPQQTVCFKLVLFNKNIFTFLLHMFIDGGSDSTSPAPGK